MMGPIYEDSHGVLGRKQGPHPRSSIRQIGAVGRGRKRIAVVSGTARAQSRREEESVIQRSGN